MIQKTLHIEQKFKRQLFNSTSIIKFIKGGTPLFIKVITIKFLHILVDNAVILWIFRCNEVWIIIPPQTKRTLEITPWKYIKIIEFSFAIIERVINLKTSLFICTTEERAIHLFTSLLKITKKTPKAIPIILISK